jgi:hypothetical protein
MAVQQTAVRRPSEPSVESELKRLRAYEGLAVALIVIIAALVFGSMIVMAVSSSLGGVAHSLGPSS